MTQLTGVVRNTITLTARSGYINRSVVLLTLQDGDVWYKKVLRGGLYCIDKSINAGVTWELNIVQLMPDEDSIIILIDAGVAGYRQVVRDGAYCIDMELTETGFDGDQDIDWENIFNTTTI